MSAFLGPIHYWLYNKIKLQNTLVESVISYTEKENLSKNLRETLDNKYGFIDNRPLEEIIDTDNIHGWLQECVSVVEYRLAYGVTELLTGKENQMGEIKELFLAQGKELSSIDENASPDAIFKQLNDTLLDGMPCDHANVLVSSNDNEVIWKRNVCVHENYWNAVGGDIKNYYILREEFIKGFISKTNATFEKVDEITSKISKRSS